MLNVFKDRSFKIAAVLTIVFLSAGFAMLHFGLANYGIALFVLLPIAVGISIGALPSQRSVLIGFSISTLIFFLFLLAAAVEGYICILMALGIIVPLTFAGIVFRRLVERYKEIKRDGIVQLSFLPLLILLVAVPIERVSVVDKAKPISVESSIVLPYSNLQVYDAIKSVDTLVGEKTLLMHIGLPIPQKCILESEQVGGIRTCYFSGGRIIERITELEKGKTLKMDVIKYELTGRKWLGFKRAIYLFDSLGLNSCRLTRVTTYTTELRPRFYWGPLERLGVEQEHQYVFNNLLADLKHKQPR